MLLAFSASPEELEVLLISLTFGNVDVPNCLRNAVSLFHMLEKEIAWRSKNGKEVGFETLRKSKPIVAVGAEEPLADQLMMADYFRTFWTALFTTGLIYQSRWSRWSWRHSCIGKLLD